jgi:UDP-N-acetylenolpyruvoylglucosamine reductase
MVEVRTAEELKAVHDNATSKSIPIFILGGGSNVIANDDGFAGLVIRIRIPGFDVVADDMKTGIASSNVQLTCTSVVSRRCHGSQELPGQRLSKTSVHMVKKLLIHSSR